MLKRQRPSSPLPTLATYCDDPPSLISPGSSMFHPGANMNTQVDPSFGMSRKRPRVSPDTIPGVTGVGGSGIVGRPTFFSSSVLSKRERSPDPMDDSDDSEHEPEPRSCPRISNTWSGYQREGESSDPFASHQPTNQKRRRTTAPVLEGSSRGWGADQSSQFGTGPGVLSSTSYPHSSFDPANPPAGWVLETRIGEYAEENAKLYDLHTLRPRLPHPEVTTQDQEAIPNVDVDMEEKVVKERYEERNKYVPISTFRPHILGFLTACVRLLGSLFLERQRRLTGT